MTKFVFAVSILLILDSAKCFVNIAISNTDITPIVFDIIRNLIMIVWGIQLLNEK